MKLLPQNLRETYYLIFLLIIVGVIAYLIFKEKYYEKFNSTIASIVPNTTPIDTYKLCQAYSVSDNTVKLGIELNNNSCYIPGWDNERQAVTVPIPLTTPASGDEANYARLIPYKTGGGNITKFYELSSNFGATDPTATPIATPTSDILNRAIVAGESKEGDLSYICYANTNTNIKSLPGPNGSPTPVAYSISNKLIPGFKDKNKNVCRTVDLSTPSQPKIFDFPSYKLLLKKSTTKSLLGSNAISPDTYQWTPDINTLILNKLNNSNWYIGADNTPVTYNSTPTPRIASGNGANIYSFNEYKVDNTFYGGVGLPITSADKESNATASLTTTTPGIYKSGSTNPGIGLSVPAAYRFYIRDSSSITFDDTNKQLRINNVGIYIIKGGRTYVGVLVPFNTDNGNKDGNIAVFAVTKVNTSPGTSTDQQNAARSYAAMNTTYKLNNNTTSGALTPYPYALKFVNVVEQPAATNTNTIEKFYSSNNTNLAFSMFTIYLTVVPNNSIQGYFNYIELVAFLKPIVINSSSGVISFYDNVQSIMYALKFMGFMGDDAAYIPLFNINTANNSTTALPAASTSNTFLQTQAVAFPITTLPLTLTASTPNAYEKGYKSIYLYSEYDTTTAKIDEKSNFSTYIKTLLKYSF